MPAAVLRQRLGAKLLDDALADMGRKRARGEVDLHEQAAASLPLVPLRMTVSTNELCKVRDSAVGGVGKGYSYAIVKRVNKKSVSLCVIDPKTLLLQPYELEVAFAELQV